MYIASSNLLVSQAVTDTLKRKYKLSSKNSLVELQKDIDAILDAPEISRMRLSEFQLLISKVAKYSIAKTIIKILYLLLR